MRAKRLFVLGHFGGSNCGDTAMLLGFLDALERRRRCCSVAIIAKSTLELSERLGCCKYQYVETLDPVPTRLVDVIKSVSWADTVVLCGGTHFEDALPMLRRWRHYLYLLRYLAVFGVALLTGRERAAIGMGIGPVRYRSTRVLLRIFGLLCDRVTLRDADSAKLFCDVTRISAPACFDLGALLDERRFLHRRTNEVLHTKTVGISVTCLRNGDEVNPLDSSQWVNELAESLIRVSTELKEIQYRILLIREGDRESDYSISVELRRSVLSRRSDVSIEIVKGCSDPDRTLGVIASCDLIIAMRYHSAVLAYLCNTPTLLLPYHKKLYQLAAELEWPDAVSVQVGIEDFSSQLTTRITSILRDPGKFAPGLAPESARQLAEQNLDSLELVA